MMSNTKLLFVLLAAALLFVGCKNKHNTKEDTADDSMVESISDNDSEKSELEIYNYDMVESDDGNLRLFSRENQQGEPIAHYENIIQFKSNGCYNSLRGTIDDHIQAKEKKKSNNAEDFDMGTYYSNIYTVKTNHQVVYLVESFNRMQTADVGYYFAAYIIENGELKKIDFFKKQGKRVSSFFIECHWCDHERIFYFDTKNTVLYVPMDDYLYRCNIEQFDKYQFGKEIMEYTETVGKRYWLHSSLRDFEPSSCGVTKQFDTENYHIRIDELENSNFRYASWKLGTPTTNKPDLVIENGKELSWGEYVFQNGEYKYICSFEMTEFRTFYGKLTVEKNGKKVLEEIILR